MLPRALAPSESMPGRWDLSPRCKLDFQNLEKRKEKEEGQGEEEEEESRKEENDNNDNNEEFKKYLRQYNLRDMSLKSQKEKERDNNVEDILEEMMAENFTKSM